jgi:hypothetical protein
MTAKQHKDGDGHHWCVPASSWGHAQIDIWWTRKDVKVGHKKVQQEELVIRQTNECEDKADVLMIDHGQVYDLIDALNKAVEHS